MTGKLDRHCAALLKTVVDDDLVLAREYGIAWQRDRDHVITYDAEYYDKCKSYEGQQIAQKINAGRVALVNRYVGANRIVDVGIGSGEFVRARPNTYGHDVNPVAMEWLKRNDLWAARLDCFAGYSFWDVIEHVPDPGVYLDQIPLHCFAFFSIPIVYTLGGIRLSKHYRPGEHLYYFTEQGFLFFMAMHGFMVLDVQRFEIDAGRESILSFAFKRFKCPSL